MDNSLSHLLIPATDISQVLSAVGVRWEKLRGKKVLLTGGTGFIGKWLLATFVQANRQFQLNARLVVVSRNPTAFLKDFPNLQVAEEVEWVLSDIKNLPLEAGMGCDFAIHAATDVVMASAPMDVFQTCAEGTHRLLQSITSASQPRRVLLLSSGAVYGRIPADIQKVEESWQGAPDTKLPASAYGEGKRVSELLCAMTAAANPDVQVAMARCFAFVGPHLPLDKHFAIGNFIDAAMHNKDIYIQGDGTPLRSYLYAADLAHWLWVLLFDAPNMGIYNVGGDEAISIAGLAQRVNDALHGRGKIHVAQQPNPNVPPQAYIPSIRRIETDLALSPSVPLDEAIKRTAHWAKTLELQNT